VPIGAGRKQRKESNGCKMKYRKKPVEIEAVCWSGFNYEEVCELGDKKVQRSGNNLLIYTLEGTMIASLGDYIIKGVSGELYPCKPDIFNLTYEKVE
jgi:uncharacterized protein (DUF2147 family)